MSADQSLIAAVNKGDLTLVKKLLEGGVSTEVQDGNGYTALHLAVVSNNHQVVDELLGHAADPNIVDRYGNGPLWTAVFNGNLKIVESLILANANAFQENSAGRSPIEMAGKLGLDLGKLPPMSVADGNRTNQSPYEAKCCPDCGAAPAGLHEPFCLKERCPFCSGQLATCDCMLDVLQLNREERAIVNDYVDDSIDPLKSICDRWSAALEAKGRVPW